MLAYLLLEVLFADQDDFFAQKGPLVHPKLEKVSCYSIIAVVYPSQTVLPLNHAGPVGKTMHFAGFGCDSKTAPPWRPLQRLFHISDNLHEKEIAVTRNLHISYQNTPSLDFSLCLSLSQTITDIAPFSKVII